MWVGVFSSEEHGAEGWNCSMAGAAWGCFTENRDLAVITHTPCSYGSSLTERVLNHQKVKAGFFLETADKPPHTGAGKLPSEVFGYYTGVVGKSQLHFKVVQLLIS